MRSSNDPVSLLYIACALFQKPRTRSLVTHVPNLLPTKTWCSFLQARKKKLIKRTLYYVRASSSLPLNFQCTTRTSTQRCQQRCERHPNLYCMPEYCINEDPGTNPISYPSSTTTLTTLFHLLHTSNITPQTVLSLFAEPNRNWYM